MINLILAGIAVVILLVVARDYYKMHKEAKKMDKYYMEQFSVLTEQEEKRRAEAQYKQLTNRIEEELSQGVSLDLHDLDSEIKEYLEIDPKYLQYIKCINDKPQ